MLRIGNTRTNNCSGIKSFVANEDIHGSVTVTAEVGTNGATTLSHMSFSGYVGHATVFT